MASEEAQRVFSAIEALQTIQDPAEQAKAVGEVLQGLPTHNKALKELRQAAVRQLLAMPGASYRTVGDELGLHFTTVRDIDRGYSGSGKNRPRKAELGQEGPGS